MSEKKKEQKNGVFQKLEFFNQFLTDINAEINGNTKGTSGIRKSNFVLQIVLKNCKC